VSNRVLGGSKTAGHKIDFRVLCNEIQRAEQVLGKRPRCLDKVAIRQYPKLGDLVLYCDELAPILAAGQL